MLARFIKKIGDFVGYAEETDRNVTGSNNQKVKQ